MPLPAALKQIKWLFHFTDRRNTASIQEHGLLPLATLQELGIVIAAPGGNKLSHDLDIAQGLDRYVHLAFVVRHPMLHVAKQDGRIEKVALVRIDPVVLEWDGVMFAPDVSNKTGVQLHDMTAAETVVDYDALYKYSDWKIPENQERRQAAERCEILVPAPIPTDLFKIFDVDG